jgi:hypothetical protein
MPGEELAELAFGLLAYSHSTILCFSLIYADDVKQRLLKYIHTTLTFSDALVDGNIISCNR